MINNKIWEINIIESKESIEMFYPESSKMVFASKIIIQ